MAKETTQTTGEVAGFTLPIVGFIVGISMVCKGHSYGWGVIIFSILSWVFWWCIFNILVLYF